MTRAFFQYGRRLDGVNEILLGILDRHASHAQNQKESDDDKRAH